MLSMGVRTLIPLHLLVKRDEAKCVWIDFDETCLYRDIWMRRVYGGSRVHWRYARGNSFFFPFAIAERRTLLPRRDGGTRCLPDFILLFVVLCAACRVVAGPCMG